MNLPHHTYQLGIRFGFPSSEKGTGFNETTSCRYYEALQYSRTNSERVEYENGDLDEESFVSWFEKVSCLKRGYKRDMLMQSGKSRATYKNWV
jgi:hypothetical protein